MPTSEPKRIYLARRKPSLTYEQFRLRWRQHGKLAMGFMARQNWENVAAYIHFDPLRDAAGIAGTSGGYDGIGCIRFKSSDARARHVQFAEARAALEADEDDFFFERVNNTGMVTSETVLRDGPARGVTKFCFLKRKSALSPAAFDDYWEKRHAPLLLQMAPTMHRYVQNHPLPSEKGSAWGLDCDGIEESWFASLVELRKSDADPGMAVVDADRDCFVQQCVTVIAQQAVLYPPPQPENANS